MPRHLPPLTALRAFESAGRHLSFTRAAEELAVTQAAISHQIKALETRLGVKLFNRLPRKLTLTEPGAELLLAISRSFDDMSDAVEKLTGRRNAGGAVLTLRSPPSFAAKWLAPKLKSFRRLHPDIKLQIRHSNEFVDFAAEEIDLAISYGDGSWPDVVSAPVLSLDFFPVCSPDYVKEDRPLDDPKNLRFYNLLHDATTKNWRAWLDLAGAEDMDAERGTILDDTNVLIQAAVDGQGIALGSLVFVEERLKSGKLIRPFELTLESDLAYHVVCPEEHLSSKPVADFRSWILAEAAN